LDCVRFAFDGENVWTIKEGLKAFHTRKNFVHSYIDDKLHFKRALKYYERGFNTIRSKNIHPLIHLQDLPISTGKEIPLKIEDPLYEVYQNYEDYYTRTNFLGYYEILNLYISKQIGYSDGKKDLVCIDFHELFNLTAEDFFIGRYKDSHFYRKFCILRCYSCGVCTQHFSPLKRIICKDCEMDHALKSEISKDLSGKTAIVTGGRIKIGFEVSLTLLRSNCYVIITTRFPTDALNRYTMEEGKNKSNNHRF
jgi:hypothetical protein